MEDRFNKTFSRVTRTVSLQAFQKYILDSAPNKQEFLTALRQNKIVGLPRFNTWKYLLQILPIDGQWQQKKQAQQISRKRWIQLKEQARTGVKANAIKQAPLPKNPLMKGMAKTEKKQNESDSFLHEQIKKDVDRTYQEMQFFQDPEILKLLTNILFVWCKINPDISYKQGMNELLASIIYVYFHEAAPSQFQTSSQLEERYIYLNNVNFCQADVFSVFQKIMDIQKQMYKQNLDRDAKGQINPNAKNNTPILLRIVQIQDQRLKALDLELFKRIKLQNVITKTFLLRWIRCMHTREFGLQGSLPIWDAIFLDNFESPNSKQKKQFQFIDAMCLAMFIYMKTVVLSRETANQITQVYQKYPNLETRHVSELIILGWNVCYELRNMNNQTTSYEVQEIKEKKPIWHNDKKQSPMKQELLKKKQELFPGQKKSPMKLEPLEEVEQTGPVSFERKEYLQVIELLKKSIHLNEDLQSKDYARKCLKLLESKLNK